AAVRDRIEAEHQRRWERPRLRGDEYRIPGDDPGFFLHLTYDGLLGRFPRRDESREHRAAPSRPAGASSEQQGPVVLDGHDHDRVRAGKVVRPAAGALPRVAGLRDLRLVAAVGAEPV